MPRLTLSPRDRDAASLTSVPNALWMYVRLQSVTSRHTIVSGLADQGHRLPAIETTAEADSALIRYRTTYGRPDSTCRDEAHKRRSGSPEVYLDNEHLLQEVIAS